jgi:hypothetical protein
LKKEIELKKDCSSSTLDVKDLNLILEYQGVEIDSENIRNPSSGEKNIVGKFKIFCSFEENSYQNLVAFHKRYPDLMEVEFGNS